MAVDISVLHFIQLSFSQKKAESLGSAAPENFVAGKSPASAAPVCSNLHQSAPTRKDKGYFTGKKQNAQAQKVLLDAATEQVGQSCRTKAVTANDQIRVSCFGPGQEIATMRMRILKKHGTGIPDAVLACLAESCRILQSWLRETVRIQPPLEDKVVALIREEFGAVVRASRKFPMAYNHFFPHGQPH